MSTLSRLTPLIQTGALSTEILQVHHWRRALMQSYRRRHHCPACMYVCQMHRLGLRAALVLAQIRGA